MTYTEAIAWAGGTQTALADKLGVWQSSVARWKAGIPCQRQMQLERMSCGALRADAECWEPEKKDTENA